VVVKVEAGKIFGKGVEREEVGVELKTYNI